MSSKFSRAIDWWGAILLAEWLLSRPGSWLSRLSLVNLPYWALLLAARLVWSEVNDFNRLPQPETGLWLVVVVGWCSSGPDPDTRHCTQHSQMSTATTGSEFVAICGICPPSIPSLKFWTSENKLLISRLKMIRWTWEVLLILNR